MNRLVTYLFLLASLALVSSSTVNPSGHLGTIPAFSDVSGNSLWSSAIRDLAERGYVRGRAANEFAPDAGVTQAEMAVLLVRVARGSAFSPPTADDLWWQSWAAEAEREGLMAHMSNPEAPATRAQMATLMWLAMGRNP
jgi:hypothetical protein